MTKTEFVQWLESTQFEFSQGCDGHTNTEVYDFTDDEGQEHFRPVCGAFVWKTAKSTMPDGSPFEVSYQEAIEWAGRGIERIGDYKASTDHGADDFVWSYSRPEIEDEDGDDLGKWGIDELVKENLPGITDIDYEGLIPAITITDIDTDTEDATMETYTITNDNAADIRFAGEHLATASSKDPYNNGGRWTVLRLYRTKGGKFICQEEGVTQWQGERDRSKAAVCANEKEVIEFFGHGRLAKDIYTEAGIDAAQDVE